MMKIKGNTFFLLKKSIKLIYESIVCSFRPLNHRSCWRFEVKLMCFAYINIILFTLYGLLNVTSGLLHFANYPFFIVAPPPFYSIFATNHNLCKACHTAKPFYGVIMDETLFFSSKCCQILCLQHISKVLNVTSSNSRNCYKIWKTYTR